MYKSRRVRSSTYGSEPSFLDEIIERVHSQPGSVVDSETHDGEETVDDENQSLARSLVSTGEHSGSQHRPGSKSSSRTDQTGNRSILSRNLHGAIAKSAEASLSSAVSVASGAASVSVSLSVADQSASMAPSQATELTTKKKKKKKCGRIQFESYFVKEQSEPPPVLYCEECEKDFAIKYCSGCDEVFCPSCLEMCHLRENLGATLHPHESLGLIRLLKAGDTSRVFKEEKYVIPNSDVFEDDLMRLVDISQPHTLVMDNSLYLQPSVEVTSKPKYTARNIVLFIDPVTGQEAYGRIISEWNFRHGESAPSVVRGEVPGVYYVIEMMEFVGEEGIQRLIEMNAVAEPPVFPVLEGVSDDPLKAARHTASLIDNKIRLSKIRKEFGPKWHFKPMNAAELEPDDESLVKGGEMGKTLGLVNDSGKIMGTISVNERTGAIRNYGSGLPEVSEEMDLDESVDKYVNYVLSVTSGAIPKYAVERRPTGALLPPAPPGHAHSLQEVVRRMHKLLVFPEKEICLPEERSNLLANERFTFLYNFIDNRFIKIFTSMILRGFTVWKENMEHLREVQHHLTARKIQKEVRRWLCRNILDNLRDEIIARRRANWEKLHAQFDYCSKETKNSVTMNHKLYFATAKKASRYAELCRRVLAKVVRHLNIRRLQALGEALQTWRSTITEFNEKMLKTCHIEAVADGIYGEDEVLMVWDEQRRALELHSKLKKKGIKAIGTDSNSYTNVAYMPMALHRQVTTIIPPSRLADGLEISATSRPTTALLLENSIEELQDSKSIESGASAPFSDIEGSIVVSEPRSPLPRESSIDSNEALPASVGFQTMSVVEEEEVEFPPWNPSSGMNLAPLPKVHFVNDCASRLSLSREDKVAKFQYQALCEGPSTDSCWIIPGRLCMGPKLLDHHKKAGLKKSELTSQALLLIAGISTFVSLMEDAEEAEVETLYDIEPLSETLKNAYKEARSACNNTFIECKTTISEETELIKQLPALSKSHHDYTKFYQRRVRALGRIRRAEEGISLAKKQVRAVPQKFDWMRIPIKALEVPSIHEILPHIWELERRLARGENLYVYSGDGHGRVGLICATLLGRLYALTPYEALYRLQASHDCAKSERSRPVTINCPQLPMEKHLITEILSLTCRVYDGLTWRSQSDPETMADDRHDLAPGTLQVNGRFPPVVPNGAVQRLKKAVYQEFDIVRDTPSITGSLSGSLSASISSRTLPTTGHPPSNLNANKASSQGAVDSESSRLFSMALGGSLEQSVAEEDEQNPFHTNSMNKPDLDKFFDKSIVRHSRDIIRAVGRKVLPPAEHANAMPLIRGTHL